MIRYGFYDSYNHDRQYNSKDFGRMFDGVITDGVFSTVGEILATIPGEGLSVIIKSGKAWFDRTWTYNDGFVTLDIDLPDVLLPRIDIAVLEIDQDIASRTNSFKIVKGTPATSPVKPALIKTETLKQYPLAYITVKANASSFTSDNIDICVGRSECPFCTPVQTVDITDLYNNWEGQFQDWFQNVKTSLEGDVALNLQRQIDELGTNKLDKTDDKATTAQAQAGTIDTKWISPLTLLSFFNSKKATSTEITNASSVNKWLPPNALKSYFGTTSVACEVFHYSKTWTKPSNMIGNKVYAIVVGGGGGGSGGLAMRINSSVVANMSGNGGAGGSIATGLVTVSSSTSVVVGEGGRGGNFIFSSTATSTDQSAGMTGNASSFGNLSASGGAGGKGRRVIFTSSSTSTPNTITDVTAAVGTNGGGNGGLGPFYGHDSSGKNYNGKATNPTNGLYGRGYSKEKIITGYAVNYDFNNRDEPYYNFGGLAAATYSGNGGGSFGNGGAGGYTNSLDSTNYLIVITPGILPGYGGGGAGGGQGSPMSSQIRASFGSQNGGDGIVIIFYMVK